MLSICIVFVLINIRETINWEKDSSLALDLYNSNMLTKENIATNSCRNRGKMKRKNKKKGRFDLKFYWIGEVPLNFKKIQATSLYPF